MLESMTGFASAKRELKSGESIATISVEMKSFNSRFAEVSVKLPPRLSSLEYELASELKRRFVRGRIFVNVKVDGILPESDSIVIDEAVVRQYLEQSERLKDNLGVIGELSLKELVVLPGAVRIVPNEAGDQTRQVVVEVVMEAASRLEEFRKREGAALEEDITRRVLHCEEMLKRIEELYNEVAEKKRQEIEGHVAPVHPEHPAVPERAHGPEAGAVVRPPAPEAGLHNVSPEPSTPGNAAAVPGHHPHQDHPVPPEQREQQLAAMLLEQLSRMDITEEMVRLRTHVGAMIATIKSPSREKGKKLDFLLQEIFRELNTAAAKSADARISSLAVDLKVEFEKIREQVQNVL